MRKLAVFLLVVLAEAVLVWAMYTSRHYCGWKGDEPCAWAKEFDASAR
jgi:hypothetical protein